MADPRDNVPPAVREQAKRADELQRAAIEAANKPDDSAKGAEGEDTLDAGLGEDIKAGGSPAGAAEAGETGGGTPTSPPPPPPASPPPPPADAGATDWEAEYRVLQAKHDSLKGKYDNEVPRLAQRLRELETRAASPSPPPPPPSAKTQLTDQEIADAGPELVTIIRKAARAEFEDEIENVRNENRQLKEQFGAVETDTRKQAYGQFLNRLNTNPQKIDWKKVQTEPEFGVFMEQPDRYTGTRRQDLLDIAVRDLDDSRVMAFYEDYLAERAGSAQTPQTGRRGNGAAPVRLDTLVNPSPRAGTTPSASTQKGRMWSSKDIHDFYVAKRAPGQSPERRAELAGLEEDLFKAQVEGRVTP